MSHIVGAFLQYYREEADYGERTHKFMERLGLEQVRGIIVEDVELRKELLCRIETALGAVRDPWKERVGQGAC